jgi:hypothetical protein
MADDLVLQDAYHLHDADEVGVQGGVHTLSSIDEAYHVVISGVYPMVRLTLSWDIWTDTLNPPRLPVLKLEAQSDHRADTPDEGLVLPGLSLEARMGAQAADLTLPDLRIDAAASHEMVISGSANLSDLRLSATTGARSAELKLSELRLSATAQGGLFGTLDKPLPGLTLSATAHGPRTGSLAAELPPLEATITMLAESMASLAGTLPPVTISAGISGEQAMTVSGILPALEIVSTGTAGSMTLNALLPTLVMAPAGGQASAGEGGVVSEDRFDDYVLRYVR